MLWVWGIFFLDLFDEIPYTLLLQGVRFFIRSQDPRELHEDTIYYTLVTRRRNFQTDWKNWPAKWRPGTKHDSQKDVEGTLWGLVEKQIAFLNAGKQNMKHLEKRLSSLKMESHLLQKTSGELSSSCSPVNLLVRKTVTKLLKLSNQFRLDR